MQGPVDIKGNYQFQDLKENTSSTRMLLLGQFQQALKASISLNQKKKKKKKHDPAHFVSLASSLAAIPTGAP